jgi:glutathione synthase/RimK-type ligase-like ATP-grasp enzyme
VEGQLIDLDEVRAIYERPPAAVTRAIDSVLHDWADVASRASVINRPYAMTPNACKPFQLRWIERHGFRVPDTLVTTNAAALQEFRQRHGDVIYKSISGVRSIVSRLHDDRDLANLRHCPTQFQQYIRGEDVRVHVVGDALFACRIESDSDDYRYARGSVPRLRSVVVPEDVGLRARAMAADMGLLVAGIDLRVTPEGEWYCFEVNPSPGFSYFAAATGDAIADAIAAMLCRSPRPAA